MPARVGAAGCPDRKSSFGQVVVTGNLQLLHSELGKSVLGGQIRACGVILTAQRKTLRQICVELIGGDDGPPSPSFPEIVGASKP